MTTLTQALIAPSMRETFRHIHFIRYSRSQGEKPHLFDLTRSRAYLPLYGDTIPSPTPLFGKQAICIGGDALMTLSSIPAPNPP